MTKPLYWLVLLLTILQSPFLFAQDESLFNAKTIDIIPPDQLQLGEPCQLQIQVRPPLHQIASLEIEIEGQSQSIPISNGVGTISYTPHKVQKSIHIRVADYELDLAVFIRNYPAWLSILPPLLAIFLALIFREVIVSLFIGILFGAIVLGVSQYGSWLGIGSGFLAVLDTYILRAVSDEHHIAILLFSLLIGGMVAIISRNGGMQGIVNRISRLAKSPQSVQFSTWLMGLVIFFDDYANALVVGNTMRSLSDKLRVSREKLAYIVDSTAAPVSALAFVTTWIGAELGYIDSAISTLPNFPEISAYSIFLSSISYSFYPILTLIFVFLIIGSKKDFGPMLKAEIRARKTGQSKKENRNHELDHEMRHFQPLMGLPFQAFHAVIPILILIGGVLIGLIYTGYDANVWADESLSLSQKMSTTVGQADSYAALLWSSLSAITAAIFLTLIQRVMGIQQTLRTMTAGFNAMMGGIIILVLAWALQALIEDMGTAIYLMDLVGDVIALRWLPLITFVLGAAVSFSTGSSWGAMAILYPLLIPLSWSLAWDAGVPSESALPVFYHVIASVLAGSVLGDHCSPISDTTILSSLACSCHHVDHVRTQLPYALLVGLVAMALCIIPTALGVPPWICYPIAVLALIGLIRFLGKESN